MKTSDLPDETKNEVTDTPRRNRLDHIPEYKLDIIFSKCVKNGECLEWTGNYFRNKNRPKWTYPYMYFKNKVWRGNRLVLFLVTGKIPKKMNALHTCDNNKCLNPNHLYWGTLSDNMQDASKRKRLKASRTTHCKRGHPYAGKNLRLHKNKRYCKSCNWYRRRNLPIGSELKYEIS